MTGARARCHIPAPPRVRRVTRRTRAPSDQTGGQRMATYLPPIERPRGLVLRLLYFFMRRQFGKVATPIAVFSARMPLGFLTFYGKLPRLDKKLALPPPTAALIRERVASLNTCLFCMDATRWYAMKRSPEEIARFDALPE